MRHTCWLWSRSAVADLCEPAVSVPDNTLEKCCGRPRDPRESLQNHDLGVVITLFHLLCCYSTAMGKVDDRVQRQLGAHLEALQICMCTRCQIEYHGISHHSSYRQEHDPNARLACIIVQGAHSGEVRHGLGACTTSSPVTLTENALRRPVVPLLPCRVSM